MGLTRGPISLATWSRVSCLRPQMTTFAPSRTNTSAIALPIPRLAPVTIAVLDSRMFTTSFRTLLGNPGKLHSQFEDAPRIVGPQHRHLFRLDGAFSVNREHSLIASVVARR